MMHPPPNKLRLLLQWCPWQLGPWYCAFVPELCEFLAYPQVPPEDLGTLSTPKIRLRVVCGLFETIDNLTCSAPFIKVLFPALGKPNRPTNPE